MKYVRHNTIKPEEIKMKTNRHLISKLSKATLIFTLVFSSLVSVSCQKTASQSFQYKTDFIKQMVYKISNEFFARADDRAVSVKYWGSEDAAVKINYSASDKHVNDASVINEKELEDFLTHAARFNSPVADVEVEKDNTLEFLTQAAQLNTPATIMETEQDNTLDFLKAAAQFNAPAPQENNANDDTLEYLINAAQLNTTATFDENNTDSDLLDFLTQAAQLNDCVTK